jgi:hypothetical protein
LELLLSLRSSDDQFPMNSAPRRSLQFAVVVALVLACLIFRRVFYFFEIAALELRYFWWLFVIIAGGLWLLVMIGRKEK